MSLAPKSGVRQKARTLADRCEPSGTLLKVWVSLEQVAAVIDLDRALCFEILGSLAIDMVQIDARFSASSCNSVGRIPDAGDPLHHQLRPASGLYPLIGSMALVEPRLSISL